MKTGLMVLQLLHADRMIGFCNTLLQSDKKLIDNSVPTSNTNTVPPLELSIN
jgi:hypothetical protein